MISPRRRWNTPPSLLGLVVAVAAAVFCKCKTDSSMRATILWSTAQMIPRWPSLASSFANSMQKEAWRLWDQQYNSSTNGTILEVPVLDVSQRQQDLRAAAEEQFGKDWLRRPLYLKGLWNASSLNDTSRRLSLEGLLREQLEVPYFTDATVSGALTPDAEAPLSRVVYNITQGHPHKITSQFMVQTYPELVKEVAPNNVLTKLFGNYFEPHHVLGSGPSGMLPALTTVPLFVAGGGKPVNKRDSGPAAGDTQQQQLPRTDLHCEPIGNVAVQLAGEKHWTLVAKEHTFQLLPASSPDGRAFFAAYAPRFHHVPRYHVVTRAGDALWIPTWMWHRVDYAGDGISIGASLFHFRPWDYLRNNPLFAALVIPSILKELVGINTQ